MFLHNKIDNIFLAQVYLFINVLVVYFLCSQHNLGYMRKKPKKGTLLQKFPVGCNEVRYKNAIKTKQNKTTPSAST